jgi:Terminase small subunit
MRTNGGNRSAAYRSAYPDSSPDPASIRSMASNLCKVPQVAAALARVDNAAQVAVRELADRYAVSQQALASMLIRLAAYDVRDYFEMVDGAEVGQRVLRVKDVQALTRDQSYAIVGIKQAKDGSISYEFADKRQAAVNLAQLMGLITDRGASAVDPVTGKPVDRFQPVVLQIVRK